MKSMTAARVEADLQAALKAAQKERIIITKSGKPCAVIVGIEAYDEEDIRWASSPDFWRMIQERRQGKSVPLAQVKARLTRRIQAQRSPRRKKR